MNSELFDKEYSRLNPDQKKAVDTIDGPVLVIAGPGTGKTQVLALRIANILKQTDTDPKSILCLTFQDASVVAMKNRLHKFIGQEAYKVQIHTFHSFCSEVIRTFPYLFDFSDDVEPIKDIDKLEIFKDILLELNLKNLQQRGDVLGNYKGIVSAISTLKKEYISPEVFEKIIAKFEESLDSKQLKLEERRLQKLRELKLFYSRYLEVMQEKSLIDFDDMIFRVTDAFAKNDELVKYFQEQYLYTLVDEFQDTNRAQLEVIKSVASFEGIDANVFAVGDDDQTIFRFQGASSDNFEKFLNIFGNTEIIVLHSNYRSDQKIIDAATNLIQNNPNRISNQNYFKERGLDKIFRSEVNFSSPIVEVEKFEHSFHEDFWIGEKILSLVESGYKLNEIALIARTNKQITNITKFLDKFGIPYQIKRSESLLDNKYIRDLLLLIQTISSPEKLKDDSLMWRIYSLDFWKQNNFGVFGLYHDAKAQEMSMLDFIQKTRIPKYDSLDSLTQKLIALQTYALNNSFQATFTKILHSLDLLTYFEALPEPYPELNRLSSLFQFIQSRSKFIKNYDIKQFLNEIQQMQDRNISLVADPIELDSEKVNILTAHGSKGLEFEHVFLYQTVENKWEKIRGGSDGINLPPLNLSDDLNEQLEKTDNKLESEIDERRLFYVAMTRAKNSLYLTYSKRYYDSDSGEVDITEKIPSKFLSEADQNDFIETVEHAELIGRHEEITKIILSPEEPVVIPEQNRKYLSELVKTKLSLSASKLNKYDKCHYKFLLEDIYGLPYPKTASLILGSAVHKGIENIHTKYTLAKSDEEFIDSIIQIAMNELNSEIDSSSLEEEGTSIEILRDDLEKSLRVYFDFFKQTKVEPIKSEFWATGTFDGIKIRGRIDMISESDFGYVITDFKTAQNVPTITEFLGLTKAGDKSYLRQLLFYRLLMENSDSALSRKYSGKIRFLRIEYIDLKEKSVKTFDIPVSGDLEYKARSNSKNMSTYNIDDEYDRLKEDLKNAFESIKSLDFVRTEDRSICQFCPFKQHCGR